MNLHINNKQSAGWLKYFQSILIWPFNVYNSLSLPWYNDLRFIQCHYHFAFLTSFLDGLFNSPQKIIVVQLSNMPRYQVIFEKVKTLAFNLWNFIIHSYIYRGRDTGSVRIYIKLIFCCFDIYNEQRKWTSVKFSVGPS